MCKWAKYIFGHLSFELNFFNVFIFKLTYITINTILFISILFV